MFADRHLKNSPDQNKPKGSWGQRGQIVLEYVLILVAAVAIAVMLTRLIVSRDPDSSGFLVKKWHEILQFIATDRPDDLNGS